MYDFDFSPLFRSTVGFDHMQKVLDTVMAADDSQISYPPYNIERYSDDNYRIVMAVAGFSKQDLNIMVEKGTLIVSSRLRKGEDNNNKVVYLHRGIAARSFERRFELADYIEVVNADLHDGLLVIDLIRQIPEALKPRKISINGTQQKKIT